MRTRLLLAVHSSGYVAAWECRALLGLRARWRCGLACRRRTEPDLHKLEHALSVLVTLLCHATAQPLQATFPDLGAIATAAMQRADKVCESRTLGWHCVLYNNQKLDVFRHSLARQRTAGALAPHHA